MTHNHSEVCWQCVAKTYEEELKKKNVALGHLSKMNAALAKSCVQVMKNETLSRIRVIVARVKTSGYETMGAFHNQPADDVAELATLLEAWLSDTRVIGPEQIQMLMLSDLARARDLVVEAAIKVVGDPLLALSPLELTLDLERAVRSFESARDQARKEDSHDYTTIPYEKSRPKKD